MATKHCRIIAPSKAMNGGEKNANQIKGTQQQELIQEINYDVCPAM